MYGVYGIITEGGEIYLEANISQGEQGTDKSRRRREAHKGYRQCVGVASEKNIQNRKHEGG